MNHPKVSIVTPIHNGIEYTEKFLKSLKKVTYPNFEIIIIDDGSTDGSAGIIKKIYPEVKILNGDGNLWWSGATNKGVEYALKRGADYILIINNDIEVETNFIGALVNCARENSKALIGSKIYYINNKSKVWYFGAKFNRENGGINVIGGKDKDFKKRENVDFLTGMGVLIPIQVFADIGFFDEKNFPQYYGDSDFSLRAKTFGYKLIIEPESKIYTNIESAWVSRAKDRESLKFLYKLLFSLNSQYNIKINYKFYKKYWGKGFIKILIKFYYHYIIDFIKVYLIKKFKSNKK